MNYNNPFALQQNLALLLSAYQNVNNNLLSQAQNQASLALLDILRGSQQRALYEATLRENDSSNSVPDQKHETASASPLSQQSTEEQKGGMDDESENNRNIHLKKSVFTITRQNKIPDSAEHEETEAKGTTNNYSRKEKSLGELSKRFLTMFGKVDDCLISLDTITKQLDVERRRVYDIINILESLGVVHRKGKNNYQWNGFQPIRLTIARLESRADAKHDDSDNQDDNSGEDDVVDQRLANKKEKSLAYLAGKFIKLFFSWKKTLPLEEAAWKLSSSDVDDHKIKTKIRRLYDIANVYSSLGLIKKITLDSKNSAFKWMGTEGLDEFIKQLDYSTVTSPELKPKKKPLKAQNTNRIAEEEIAKPVLRAEKSAPPASVNQQSNKPEILDNFLSMLLNLCQQNNQPTNVSPTAFAPKLNQFNSNPLCNYMNFNQGLEAAQSLQRNALTFNQTNNLGTPTTSDNRRKVVQPDGSVLKTKTTDNLVKRPATQTIGGFEIKTVKQIQPLTQTSTDKTIARSFKFSPKESIPCEAKVEN